MNSNLPSFIGVVGAVERLLGALPQAFMVTLADRRLLYRNAAAEALQQQGHVGLAAQHLMRIAQWQALALEQGLSQAAHGPQAIELPLCFLPGLSTGVLQVSRLAHELAAAAAWPADCLLLTVLQDRPALSQAARLDALCLHCALSAAERQVLVLLAQGLGVAAAAQQLGLCVSTVRCHVRHLLKKTGSSSLAQMLCWIGSAREGPG